MAESRCMQRVLTGAALGGAVGGAVGACYGTYEAFAYKVRAYDWTTPHNARFVSILFFLPLFLLADDLIDCLSLFLSLFFAQIPGMLKVRHIGRTTMGSAGLFSLFLGAGSLLHCGRRS